jgi:hypothetical protein
MPTKSAGSSQKDWRPPCTKTSDPDAYRRVGEIVETIILNGEIPGKRTFREVDPELWDRFKESSIKNTLLTWKKKIYATHREEGINKDQNKGEKMISENKHLLSYQIDVLIYCPEISCISNIFILT